MTEKPPSVADAYSVGAEPVREPSQSLGRVHPASKPTTRVLRDRIKAAAALHQHEPNGAWVECDGREYAADKGCATLRALKVQPKRRSL